MNNPASPLERKVLLEGTKEQLVDLLLLAIEGQKKATENVQSISVLLSEARSRVLELEDKLSTQESELILLRNRP